jgi:4-hydroxythreonine-4-phosphate dehydrogenase
MKKAVIAVTMGDPAGVGPEVVLKALQDARRRPARGGRGPRDQAPGGQALLVIGDLPVLEAVNRKLGIGAVLQRVEDPADPGGDRAGGVGGPVRVLDIGAVPGAGAVRPGEVSAAAGRAAAAYIERAAELARAGLVAGIATAPVNKKALRAAGYPGTGHTEMLAGLFGSARSVTMFQVEKLRIFFHSRHFSLRAMLDALDPGGVKESIAAARACLASIGVESPRLALAALNPHASDGGLFGDEEERILAPACARARERGIDVAGPVPADSVFNLALEGRFDAVVSLYHDQGHIAAKTYDFYRTVSVTFGLPVIRTSVDHGTAFDIAWQGRADPVSMVEAVGACLELAGRYHPVSW